jgi:hypothetical protein
MLNMELGMVGLEKYFDSTTPGVRALWSYSKKILVGFSNSEKNWLISLDLCLQV